MKLKPIHLASVILALPMAAPCQAQNAPAAAAAATRPDQPGSYRVGHLTDSATDHCRNRTLRYDVWYPVDAAQTGGAATVYELDELFHLGHPVPYPSPLAREGVTASAAGPFPLIVYSHSGGGHRFEAYDVCEVLATHGYVVFSPDHAGSAWANDTDPALGDATDALRVLRLRAPDLSFLIDTALARHARPGDLLRGRIDGRHIGGFGWSFGGFSIAALGGGYKDSCPDARLDAMVLFSPSTWVMSPAELERINVPVIALTGTEDNGIRFELADAFARFSGPHMTVSLAGADHGSFGAYAPYYEYMMNSDQPEDVLAVVGKFPAPEVLALMLEHRRLETLYAVAGFDRYLKNSSTAAAWLTKSYAAAHEPKVAHVRIGVSPDLNGNDIVDAQDIASGSSRDRNRNGVPDEVDGPVLRVRAGATGDNSGTSWPNATGSLTRALELARSSRDRVKEIWVAAGEYAPAPAGGDQAASFMVRNVEVLGGFSGGETRRAQRNPAANVTVLTGDLAGDDLPDFGNRGDNARHVVSTVRSSQPSVLDGCTVRGGHNPDGYGGGIFMFSGRIQNCTITDNYCPNGGGLASYYGEGALQDCLFLNNAGLYGGAIALDDGSLAVSGCRFEGNWSAGDANRGYGTGGAAYVYSNGHLTMHNCELVNNTSNYGGAICVDNNGPPCTLTAVNCLFAGNTAPDLGADAGGGAALWLAADQTARLTNVTAAGNTSALSPWHNEGALTIHNSIIRDGAGWLGGVAVIKYSNLEGGAAGTGNLSSDPFFANAAAGDYRLTTASPCRNAGKNSLLPADTLDLDGDGNVREVIPWDLSGLSRIRGSSVDMGAYESR